MQTIELLRWRRSVLIITNNVILHYIYCSDAWIVFQSSSSSSLEVDCLGHEELLSDCYIFMTIPVQVLFMLIVVDLKVCSVIL